MRTGLLALLVALPLSACAGPGAAEDPGAEAPADAPFVVLRHDAESGRVWLRPRPEGERFLYHSALAGGLGSNDVGLDRGQLGRSVVVEFRRVGPRWWLVAPNLDRVVDDASPAARRAAEDSFAPGVLAAFEPVEGEPGGPWLDATEFLVRDAHGVARALDRAGQGSFRLDGDRSAVLPESLSAFPDNAVVEALLTFASDAPGPEVRATAALPEAVTLRVRHGFARLPGDGYRPRADDPRAGYFERAVTVLDAPVDAPTRRGVIARHRVAPGGEPLVYYVDRAAPEPVRTALVEGARYWERAFDAAGLPGQFRVELLPEDADPLDLRYDVIQWVYRSTRGWSYGASITDPRTGEILKGHVSLGALRVRQDVLLMEGLLAPYGGEDSDGRAVEVALARLRQLAAHEVGHTLGLRHNFAASLDGRESVMDYPHPEVALAGDGGFDVSDAYRDGVGAWDVLTIRYGYTPFAPEEEAAGLAAIVDEMEASGLAYLSDADASAGVSPTAHRWDRGTDVLDALESAYAVRERGLARFGEASLRGGRPLSDLELALVPLAWHHRYQLEAAATELGGVAYRHQVRGAEPAAPTAPVPAERQRRALALCLRALDPDFVALPDDVVALLPPPAPGRAAGRERFDPRAFLVDPVAVARALGGHAFAQLADRDRLARLERQRALDPALPGAAEVLGAVVDATFKAEGADDPVAAAVRAEVLEGLLDLLADPRSPETARDALLAMLVERSDDGRWISGPEPPLTDSERLRLERFLAEPEGDRRAAPSPRVPPGPPIGGIRAAPPIGGMWAGPPIGGIRAAPPTGGMWAGPPIGGMWAGPPIGPTHACGAEAFAAALGD